MFFSLHCLLHSVHLLLQHKSIVNDVFALHNLLAFVFLSTPHCQWCIHSYPFRTTFLRFPDESTNFAISSCILWATSILAYIRSDEPNKVCLLRSLFAKKRIASVFSYMLLWTAYLNGCPPQDITTMVHCSYDNNNFLVLVLRHQRNTTFYLIGSWLLLFTIYFMRPM